jgi:hypothetical protein
VRLACRRRDDGADDDDRLAKQGCGYRPASSRRRAEIEVGAQRPGWTRRHKTAAATLLASRKAEGATLDKLE